ncbi:hypothetical protein [Mesorhizobium humile]|jgi:hypothetical protein|uniref:DUF982 domain-containing protein n=1 Tax=Mesorhizobium humile TaxID=3072313 RepID=A0ABU4YNZ6_9HYPH|nr:MULTISPECIES: hypothetical protein [unclassified Mesorhizobium]MDX8457923.1 hypothetical protein [Mesorhizobium sp. VK2D]MDX8488003.1 hypothetical protein [Mesorhizobium sp. VK2B]
MEEFPMKPLRAIEADQPEIFAIIKRELPAIHLASRKMGKQLRGLSDVSQKKAIAELMACWVAACYPEDLELQLSLAEAICDQAEINLTEAARMKARRQQH